ncbi:TraH family protein [Ancylobacter sp. VNQ12]|uniref:TraH family protein n=1 Tax=Ancylobacter sp. VNQ12 TaxID=3400920 RepID=UPI003C00EB90
MIDAALIQKCADPSLKPAIVERFIAAAGSSDPLSMTVRSGDRVVLVAPAKTPKEAMALARQYVGKAAVRAGITQYPAGLGVTDVAELKPGLFEACANISMGTVLFAKVYRIVTKWYGTPTDEAFDDAIDAWKSGYFEGKYIFGESDPGEVKLAAPKADDKPAEGNPNPDPTAAAPADPNKAGIRIDLSGIGGAK